MQVARLCLLQLGYELDQHLHVVAGTKCGNGEDSLDFRALQRVSELARSIGRIDIHEDDTYLRGRHL